MSKRSRRTQTLATCSYAARHEQADKHRDDPYGPQGYPCFEAACHCAREQRAKNRRTCPVVSAIRVYPAQLCTPVQHVELPSKDDFSSGGRCKGERTCGQGGTAVVSRVSQLCLAGGWGARQGLHHLPRRVGERLAGALSVPIHAGFVTFTGLAANTTRRNHSMTLPHWFAGVILQANFHRTMNAVVHVCQTPCLIDLLVEVCWVSHCSTCCATPLA